MKLKWRVLRVAVLSCVLLTSVYAIGNTLTGRSAMDSGAGLILVKPAFAQTGDASFLEKEAGIAAYVNVGKTIDLARAKTAYRTVEKETQNYIIGSVTLPDYDASEDVHLYVQQNGWIVAYYTKDTVTIKIMDWKHYSLGKISTKLELGLKKIGNSLGLGLTNITYYHFKYPSANKLMLIATSGPAGFFKFTIPVGILVDEVYYSSYLVYWPSEIISQDIYAYWQLDGKLMNQLIRRGYYSTPIIAWPTEYGPTKLDLDIVPIGASHLVGVVTRGALANVCISLVYQE